MTLDVEICASRDAGKLPLVLPTGQERKFIEVRFARFDAGTE